MNVLVCNAGSTSLKYKLFSMPQAELLASCSMERIGNKSGGRVRYSGRTALDETMVIPDYETGIRVFLGLLTGGDAAVLRDTSEISAVGFKTVLAKGYPGVHIIDDDVLRGMEEYLTVAPAHNRHYLAAIGTFRKILPDTPMVGAFETAFHQTMPREAAVWSVPYEWYEKYGVRRMGYHGASHEWVAGRLTGLLGERYRAVSCHLGGSCSLCAIRDGRSVDTSFGMSLQTGLPQSNRSGDVDPFVIRYMTEYVGMPLEEVFRQMETQGGLLGLSGVSGDLRDVEAAAREGNERAALAVKVFLRELVRYIGGYAAVLGGLDAIALTGGIGENSTTVQDYVLEKLAFLGVSRGDREKEGESFRLTARDSRVAVFVIPANEELGVAEKTWRCIRDGGTA